MTSSIRAWGLMLLFLTSMSVPIRGNSDQELKLIRDIALSLLNRNTSSLPKAYCELTTMRPTNSCTNPDRLEDRLMAHENGEVNRIVFRSWAEAPNPRPGEYKGKFTPAQWKTLLVALSKMEWVKPKFDMPPPGPSETYSNLTVSDGTRKASYSIAGTGPMDQSLISDAFDQMSQLGEQAKDTLWSLVLQPQKSGLKGGVVRVDAKWVMTGKIPIEVAIRSDSRDSSCGTTTLAWFYDKPETPGVTPLPVEFNYTLATPRTAANTPWVKLDAATQARLQFGFQLPKQLLKKKKVGKLAQLGVLVKTTGSTVPINVSLFSESIPF